MDQTTAFRAQMTALGASAGLALWVLLDWLPDHLEADRLRLLMVVALGAAFWTALTLGGAVALRRLALPALALGAVLGGMVWWASFRFDAVDPFLELLYPVVATGMALTIAIPFLGAGLRGRWTDYPTLFELTWSIVARVLAALVFTAIVWSVVWLSDALLKIVGIDLITRLLQTDWVPFVLSGAVFGLALAVVHEMRALISPDLLLRLLRLLAPVLLAVTAVFLAALPFRGLSGLVGTLSPAATLLAVALAAVVLVTVSVDRDDAEAVAGAGMRRVVRLLAALTPVLALLALYAIWLRIDQHGLTPRRIWALTVGVVTLIYGLAYTLCAVRSDWMSGLRRANVGIAMLVLLVCLGWLTPLFSPEAISARSQLRLLAVAETPDRSALYALAHDWGRPGRAALARLETEQPALAPLIAEARQASSRWLFESGVVTAEAGGDLWSQIRVVPADALAGPEVLRDLPDYLQRELAQACAEGTPVRPGCLLLAPPGASGVLLFTLIGNERAQVRAMRWVDGALSEGPLPMVPGQGEAYDLDAAVVEEIAAGRYVWGPVPLDGLTVGDVAIIPDN